MHNFTPQNQQNPFNSYIQDPIHSLLILPSHFMFCSIKGSELFGAGFTMLKYGDIFAIKIGITL